jgi:hypothetical protein
MADNDHITVPDPRPEPDDYAPYHLMFAFNEGAADYKTNWIENPYTADSVEAQAWGRGLEYAMRLARWVRRGSIAALSKSSK